VHVFHGESAPVLEDERYRLGHRAQGPDGDSVRARVRAEHRMRVVVVSGDNPFDLAQA
jgi:hypothetical protein